MDILSSCQVSVNTKHHGIVVYGRRGRRGTRIRWNLKSGKIARRQWRNKFHPLATGGGYMSRRGCHQYKYLREIPVHISVLEPRDHVCGPIHGKTSRIYSINSYTTGYVASCYEFLQSDRVNRVNGLLSLFFFFYSRFIVDYKNILIAKISCFLIFNT